MPPERHLKKVCVCCESTVLSVVWGNRNKPWVQIVPKPARYVLNFLSFSRLNGPIPRHF